MGSGTDQEGDSSQSVNEDISNSPQRMAKQLLFAFDLEATGVDFSHDRIIEIAAHVVLPSSIKSLENSLSFSSLVKTNKAIPEAVIELTGIDKLTLRGKPKLPLVLNHFVRWITTIHQEVEDRLNRPVVPVLIAHFGFHMDFPMLLHEIRRHRREIVFQGHGVPEDMFQGICFADSLEFMKELRRCGLVRRDLPMGLSKLVEEFCENPPEFKAHRALEDARALAHLLQTPKIRTHVNRHLTVISLGDMSANYQRALRMKPQLEELHSKFGGGFLDYRLAEYLVSRQVTYKNLIEARDRCRTPVEFQVDLEDTHHLRLYLNQAEKIFDHLIVD